MRHLLAAALAASVLASAAPATAQQEPAPVPVEKASYHWPVFHNELVTVLRVIFPPGRGSNYHIHSTDQLGVLVEAGENSNQEFGKDPTPPRAGKRGSVGFTAYSKKTFIHRSTNLGKTPFHNVVVSLKSPQPSGFTAGSRADVAAYQQVLDNERARAWRLILDPGQSAAAITQSAPGMRVVLEGGEITESAVGLPDRGQALRLGDFYWQDAGPTRTLKNTGSSRIEIVEFELK
jgi:opacity protein-like surface antigen